MHESFNTASIGIIGNMSVCSVSFATAILSKCNAVLQLSAVLW